MRFSGCIKIAIDYQKTKSIYHWPTFEKKLVETEMEETRQWKILIDNRVACVWATAFSDPLIWGERDAVKSIYIHRIATNPDFRGKNFVVEIVKWARKYAQENDAKFIRMDTVGDNQKLIGHYQRSGFNFLGLFKLKNTEGLPAHYYKATVSLFEIPLD